MQTITSYRDLEAYQLGMDLAEASRRRAQPFSHLMRLERERGTFNGNFGPVNGQRARCGEPTNPESRIPNPEPGLVN
jgi:hypothetical protein